MKSRHYAAIGLLTLAYAGSASAITFKIDNFTIEKNGATFFQDDFNNGILPTNEIKSNGRPRYLLNANGAPGVVSETGSKLSLNPELVPSGPGLINPAPRHVTRLRYNSNSSNANSRISKGLKDTDLIKASTTWDLDYPVMFGDRYGTRLSDRKNFQGSDILEAVVRYDGTGQVFVQYRDLDIDNLSINVIDEIALTAAALGLTNSVFNAYDQITLSLFNKNKGNKNFFSSFILSDSDTGISAFNYNFTGSTTIFNGERFTRAEFIARAGVRAVPEPSTFMLLGLGFLMTGVLRRKKTLSMRNDRSVLQPTI